MTAPRIPEPITGERPIVNSGCGVNNNIIVHYRAETRTPAHDLHNVHNAYKCVMISHAYPSRTGRGNRIFSISFSLWVNDRVACPQQQPSSIRIGHIAQTLSLRVAVRVKVNRYPTHNTRRRRIKFGDWHTGGQDDLAGRLDTAGRFILLSSL